MDFYLFLDFETEGLDVSVDRMLEVGWVLTDSDLREVGNGSALFKVPGPLRMNSFVTDMHEKSGLLADLADPEVDKFNLYEVEHSINALVDSVVKDGETVRLAGSGVGFDMKFIESRLPNLRARLHYQIMDTSVVRRFLRDVCGLGAPELVGADKTEGLTEHRAWDDAEMARRELLRYREFVRKAVGE